jgi:hypothetical protein
MKSCWWLWVIPGKPGRNSHEKDISQKRLQTMKVIISNHSQMLLLQLSSYIINGISWTTMKATTRRKIIMKLPTFILFNISIMCFNVIFRIWIGFKKSSQTPLLPSATTDETAEYLTVWYNNRFRMNLLVWNYNRCIRTTVDKILCVMIKLEHHSIFLNYK